MGRLIIHCDMDAFYAAVEARDDPKLVGKPLIIGALPHEKRGIVCTCSYEARKFGVRSAMSIKEAYRLCPGGIYMHPNFKKYEAASRQIHEIWGSYTDVVEYVALDEGFLDVSGSAHLFGGATEVGRAIKRRVKEETGLACSVGVGYSMMSAKLACEEKKPDGFYEIMTPEALRGLIADRSVRVIFGVGAQTASQLGRMGIETVRDVCEKRQAVMDYLGNHGKQVVDLAEGRDEREVARTPKSRSLGKEHTFSEDVTDFGYLKDVLLLIAKELGFDVGMRGIFCRTVTLKITYHDMKRVTRSMTGEATNRASDIYGVAVAMLEAVERRPVRLLGVSLGGLVKEPVRQAGLFDVEERAQSEKLAAAMAKVQKKYGVGAIKTGEEVLAEKRVGRRQEKLGSGEKLGSEVNKRR